MAAAQWANGRARGKVAANGRSTIGKWPSARDRQRMAAAQWANGQARWILAANGRSAMGKWPSAMEARAQNSQQMAPGDNQQHEGRKLDTVTVRMIDDGRAQAILGAKAA
jgi:hypothetical protein